MQPYQPNQPSLLSPTLSQAIQAARSWVEENAADKPGCLGAYIGGSAPTLSPEDRLEPLYDLAARIGHTPLPYSTDISPLSPLYRHSGQPHTDCRGCSSGNHFLDTDYLRPCDESSADRRTGRLPAVPALF